MNDKERRRLLETSLSAKRYRHSLNVSSEAAELAKRFAVNVEKAALAGLLHDCAREYTVSELQSKALALGIEFGDVERYSPVLLHAPVGAVLVETKYQVNDAAIKEAIALHTVGGRNMSALAKIIYLADMIEPGRDFPQVEKIRRLARQDLDQAMMEAYNQSIDYIMKKNGVIHPSTVEARNELLLKSQG